MRLYLFPGGYPHDGPDGVPVTAVEIPFTWKRPLAVAAVAILAAALHGLALLWYVNRPAPPPVSEAVPLPMIDLVLSAPPSPAAVQPVATPPPVPPKETKKPEPKPVKKLKPKPMPKPKPVRQDPLVKPVEPQKPEARDSAPPAPAAPPAPVHTAPRNDVYTPARSNADYLNNPVPVYPAVARRRHWEGLVLLKVYVTEDGRCGQASVQRGSGYEVLDSAALDAVKKWRFVPAKRGDVAQASWVTVPIEFQLK